MELGCVVYMGREDMRRQSLNVYKMRLLGAEVVPVDSGTATLKDATNEAIRDWVTNVADTHYVIGSAVGPHPYPALVRRLQRVIGDEAKQQMQAQAGGLPDVVVACVGGGSNAIGIFAAFLDDHVELLGVEAAGRGLDSGEHAAPLARGHPGVLHGARSYLLQDSDGQVLPTHSISAGLDYPGVGPEHSALRDSGRVTYIAVSDDDALSAFHQLCRLEGIIPALESAHALSAAVHLAASRGIDQTVLVCLSGRGDKDIDTVRQNADAPG
jgi:tryptophan synthase beta chain